MRFFALFLLGLLFSACDPHAKIPHAFQTPKDGVVFPNKAIRAALIEIKSDEKVINASYNVWNDKRVWVISRSEYLTMDNDDQKRV